MMDMVSRIKGAIFPAKVAMEVCRQFKKREVMSRARYRGNFDLAQDLKLGVQIYPRTREETFPTLKRFSKKAEANPSADACAVKMQRTYTEVDDPDQKEVPSDQQRKAYFYGKQLVPVSDENVTVLKGKIAPKKPVSENEAMEESKDQRVKPEDVAMGIDGDVERQFKMLGFADQSSVPRHQFMSGVDVVLPLRGSKNERAFAALVTQMIDTKKCIIARLLERKNADPKLVSLFPHVNKRQPLLYLVQLPTNEDIRDYQFPSLVASTNAQRKAASDFIDALDLTREDEERIDPKMTFNPALQYFAQVVSHKISNPGE